MQKNNMNLPDVNKLIVKKLRFYPRDVSELAITAVQMAESESKDSMIEILQNRIRELAKHSRGNE